MSARTGFLAATAFLTAVNLATAWLPGWTYLPLNLAAIAVLVVISRRSGATDADLGLHPSRLRRGLLLGFAIGVGFAVLIAVAALVPALEDAFTDDRAAGIGAAGLLYQVALRIPLGTALFEELAFRGALLAMGRAAWGRSMGTAASAVLFGLWHIIPGLEAAEGNAGAAGVPAAWIVTIAVVGTAVAGVVFTWMRDRSGSLATPVIVHALVNGTAFTAAWLIL